MLQGIWVPLLHENVGFYTVEYHKTRSLICDKTRIREICHSISRLKCGQRMSHDILC